MKEIGDQEVWQALGLEMGREVEAVWQMERTRADEFRILRVQASKMRVGRGALTLGAEVVVGKAKDERMQLIWEGEDGLFNARYY